MQSTASPLEHAHDPDVRSRWIATLAKLIAFPTVSSRSADRSALRPCAQWLANHLRAIGLQRVQVVDDIRGGSPSVLGDWLGAPGRITALLYGHYDVQPAQPLEEWKSDPFRARIADGKIYGRGASDDKGQLFIHLCALESYLQTGRALPVNVKVWFEGEEESASPTLEAFLTRHADAIRANAAVVSDSQMAAARPAIVYGLRGSLPFELEIRAASAELHGGRFGGAVMDPIQHLCRLVASMHDQRGRIAIPEFMRSVRDVPWSERAALREHDHAEEVIRKLGALPAMSADGFSAAEHATIRPSITFHGISGGYTGGGWKAIVPAQAKARASARLVPDQDPAQISSSIAAFVEQTLPRGMRWELHFMRGTRGVRMSTRHPVFRAAARAVQDVWNHPPIFAVSGGTIPVVEALHRRFGIPVVVMGFGSADDRIHGPNERFDIATFHKGVDTMIRLLAEFAG